MIAEACLKHVKQIADFLDKKNFLVGDNVTYVDFTLFEYCDFLSWITDGAIYKEHPNLLAYHNRVKNLPKLKEFYANDQKCIKRPFHNTNALINN